MTKLSQIVAVEKGVKTDSQRVLTEAYHAIQAPTRFQGIARDYTPTVDDGDQLPPESTMVQETGEELLSSVTTALTRMWDVVATKDLANTEATADIEVDGTVLAENVPVTTLLWFEKQLVDLHTFVSKLPTLDPGKKWKYDENTAAFAAEPVETVRTKKVLKNHVKAVATAEHPAQVEVFNEDVIIGRWKTIHLSGAFPAARKNELLRRVGKLQEATKFAREEANSTTIQDVSLAEPILSYLTATD